MAQLELSAVHRPKLINTCRKTLTHHLPPHTPIRIDWDTSKTHRSPAPSAIDRIQHPHNLFSGCRLGDREEVFRELTFLGKVDQKHLSFAVFESWSEDSIHSFYGSFCHKPNIVSWVRQFD